MIIRTIAEIQKAKAELEREVQALLDKFISDNELPDTASLVINTTSTEIGTYDDTKFVRKSVSIKINL